MFLSLPYHKFLFLTQTEVAKAPAKAAGKAPPQKKGDEDACPSLLDIRVGEVLEVEAHPSSDTLYVEKINVGEAQPRQIVRSLSHISGYL